MNHKVNIIVLIIVVFLICSCIKNKEDDDEDKIVEGMSTGSKIIMGAWYIAGIISLIAFLVFMIAGPPYIIYRIARIFISSDDDD